MSDSDRSTSRGGISRRMLTGGGALLPFALLNLKMDAAGSPDPVLSLYQEWQRLQVSVTELCHRCQDLEKDLIRRSATPGTQHHTEGQTNARAAPGRARRSSRCQGWPPLQPLLCPKLGLSSPRISRMPWVGMNSKAFAQRKAQRGKSCKVLPTCSYELKHEA